MVFHKNDKTTPQQGVKFKRSLLAMCVMALSAPSFAQDTNANDNKDVEEVVVTGMRQQLSSAQEIKRNSATVVDSITAEDAGSFPDKSVAEALQRVAGVTISRFAAQDDTVHFSAEPSQVVVRGLNQVRTEFNGRDSFSANASRGLSWGDISPELMAGVDTYKNQMAELIEGGIAGTVNMRTLVPFDKDGQVVSVSAATNYGDLSEEYSPEFSGLYSNRWETGVGEFGFLINGAFSDVTTRTQGNTLGVWLRYRDLFGDVSGRPELTTDQMKALYGFSDPNGLGRTKAYKDAYGTDEGAYNTTLTYIPNNVGMRDNTSERTRNGFSLAGQWADNDDVFLATVQFNRSDFENEFEERGITVMTPGVDIERQSVFKEHLPQTLNGEGNIENWKGRPAALVSAEYGDAADFTFDNRGLFQTGIMTANLGWVGGINDWGQGWTEENIQAHRWGTNSAGQPIIPPCYGWTDYANCDNANGERGGLELSTLTRYSIQENMTQDASINLKWTPTDTLTAHFDLQYVESTVQNYDIETGFSTFTTAGIDMSGGAPALYLDAPVNNRLVDAGAGVFANANSYRPQLIMDHLEDSEGDQLSVRTDFEFQIDSGWVESVKVGARFAERDQDIRWTKYNWQNVANTWTEGVQNYYNLDRHDPATVYRSQNGAYVPYFDFAGYPQGYYETRQFASDNHALYDLTGGNSNFVFWDMNMMKDRELMASQFGAQTLGFVDGIGWDPICSNTGDRADEIAGTCFRPGELIQVNEETSAIYAQLNFGGNDAELFGVPVSGNFGVRVVKTDNISDGAEDLPGISAADLECKTETRRVGTDANGDNIPDDTTGDGIPDFTETSFRTAGCYLSDEDKAFMNASTPGIGNSNLSTVKTSHTNVLPSFNIKFDLNDEWLTRIAVSKAMARPDLGLMKNYASVTKSLPTDPTQPGWITDSNGQITGVNVRYTGNMQNPRLKPIEANQIDGTLEYYWSDTGSFTTTVFYKQFDNYIQNGKFERSFTSNGVTRSVEMSGPVNGDGASIRGFEFAYQTFFDMLPAPFDGFGIQANYTRIYNEGVKNSNTNINDPGDGTTNDGTGGRVADAISVDRLEGLSDHGANFVAMYEKNDWALRLAYSWRSEYMITAMDCCVLRPVWTEATGQLDGSIRYNFNENIEVSFQASNILNEETVTTMQLENDSDGGLRAPYAWFQNDRRLTLSLRMNY